MGCLVLAQGISRDLRFAIIIPCQVGSQVVSQPSNFVIREEILPSVTCNRRNLMFSVYASLLLECLINRIRIIYNVIEMII